MKPGNILFILMLSFAYLSEYSFVNDAKPDLNTPDVGKAWFWFKNCKSRNINY